MSTRSESKMAFSAKFASVFFLRYIALIVDVEGKQSPGSKNTEIAALRVAAFKFR